MALQQIEKHQNGVYGVIGDLTFASVVHVEQEGLSIINASREPLVFDLTAVQACSSAALGLLLSWVRTGRNQGIAISFKTPPKQLQSLIDSAHLQAIIQLVT